jgi:hypothetical protein
MSAGFAVYSTVTVPLNWVHCFQWALAGYMLGIFAFDFKFRKLMRETK